jgi:hypothetical protein
MKIKLINEFHDTECFVITKDGNLSARQVKEAKKKLCPYRDCQCSGKLGVRGFSFEADTVKTVMVFQNGTAWVGVE